MTDNPVEVARRELVETVHVLARFRLALHDGDAAAELHWLAVELTLMPEPELAQHATRAGIGLAIMATEMPVRGSA